LGGKENGQKRVKKGQKRGILQLKPQLLVWRGNCFWGFLGFSKKGLWGWGGGGVLSIGCVNR